MDLNEITIFIKVVQTKSFTAAAQALGMPKSTVSAKVSSLESGLGVTLMERSTRSLRVTEAGEIFYQRCLKGLVEFNNAEAELMSLINKPIGKLRISFPADLGYFLITEVIPPFVKAFPEIDVELVLTNQVCDLLGQGIDLAVRAGHLSDSNLMGKKLGNIHSAIYCSSTYAKENPHIQSIEQLISHPCLTFNGYSEAWPMQNGEDSEKVPISKKISVNDFTLLKELTLSGAGIALLPQCLCFEEVKSGQLVRLFPGWLAQRTPLHLVYPRQKYMKPKVQAFLDFCVPILRDELKAIENIT